MKKIDTTKCNQGCGTLLIGMLIITITLENLHYLVKLNICIPFDLEIPILHLYPTETNTYVHQNTCTKIFIAVRIVTAPNWKELKCPPIINKDK